MIATSLRNSARFACTVPATSLVITARLLAGRSQPRPKRLPHKSIEVLIAVVRSRP